jgi:predicted AAA+ superfamily ATPase
MESLSAAELGMEFDLDFALNWGLLPFVLNDPDTAADILAAYVNTYLKEELQAEGLIRSVPPFVRFLAVAGQINGQIVNAQNLSREASVARSTVDTYFAILTDTLVGHILPAWRPGLKVREAAQPKFYWFDPGVARAAAGLLRDPADRQWQGLALETLVYHELRVYNEISGKHRPVSYYRTPAGVEVDFIVETLRRRANASARVVAIEIKRAERWDRAWDKALRGLADTAGVKVERMIGVYCGSRRYEFDNVSVLPVAEFVKALFAGEVF